MQFSESNHTVTFGYRQRRILALGLRFGPVLAAQDRLLWLPEVILTKISAADPTMGYDKSRSVEPKPQK